MRVRSTAAVTAAGLVLALAVGAAPSATAQQQPDPPAGPDAPPQSGVADAARAELERARPRLAEVAARRAAAEAELAAAIAERAALEQAQGLAEAQESAARRDMGNLARLAYTSGSSEWDWVEGFLDAEGPQDAMRRATTSLIVAERRDSQWRQAAELVRQATDQRRAAAARVAAAESAVVPLRAEHEAAEAQVRALEELAAGSTGALDGLAAVQRACEGVSIPQCRPSGWGEGMLTRDAVWLMRVVRQRWPEVREVGGYRPVDPYPDHPSGRAVDVMVPDGGKTSRGAAVGDEVARYFMEHAEEYGVEYLIWRQRIWRAGSDPVAPVERWRVMGDRGDRTSNHYDHVHITVSTGVSGSALFGAVAAGRASQTP